MQHSLQRNDDAQAENPSAVLTLTSPSYFTTAWRMFPRPRPWRKSSSLLVRSGSGAQTQLFSQLITSIVVAGVSLEGDEPLVWAEAFQPLDGIIEGVAENRAEIEGRDECAVGEMNDGVEIDLLFPRLARFVTQDDVEGVVACVMIILVACDLRAQFARSVLRRAVSCSSSNRWFLRSW